MEFRTVHFETKVKPIAVSKKVWGTFKEGFNCRGEGDGDVEVEKGEKGGAC